MPTAVGPNTKGEENLVFGYDLSDTGNSYKGEPAVNLVTNAATFNGGWATYDNGNDGTFITEFGTVGYQMVNRGSWNGIYQNFNLVTSGTYTFSAWFKYLGGAASPNGGTVYISNYGGGDTASGVNKDLIGQWQRVTKTISVTSPTNVYFYIISYGGTYGGDAHSWQVTMPQIELNSHATPFVGGTRSATQGLLDLTGNSTIDLTNVSFDSSAQMTFDGSDDFIDLGSSTIWNLGQNGTIETVVRREGDVSTNHRIWCTFNNSSHLDAYLDFTTGGLYLHGGTVGTNTQIPLNQYLHIIIRYSDGTVTIWYNGISQSLTGTTTGYNITNPSYTTLYLGRYVDTSGYRWNGKISGFKIYNRALTDLEIKSNYNAIKGRFNI